MRVIAGNAKGRRLQAPRGLAVRPTAARVRESLFGMLAPRLEEARVLDLFAGAGTLGIEALSRGASHVTFVDASASSLRALAENLRRTRLEDRARVIRAPAERATRLLRDAGDRFDLVLCDPPYGEGRAASALGWVAAAGLVAPDGIAVILHARRDPPPDEGKGLLRTRQRRYGMTEISFYEPEKGN